MPRTFRPVVVCAVLAAAALGLAPRPVRADEPAAAAPAAPATAEVRKGPFTPVVEMDGSFDAKDAVDVAYRPEGHDGEMELEVAEAPTFGPIAAGAIVVRFKGEKMDDELKESEAELKLARAALAHQVEEANRQEEGTAVAVKKAERERKVADEALKTFVEVERPLRVKESEHEVQSYKDSIQDQTEELAQLEKMYKADEVIEETEEIVLKRTRRGLERAKESLGFTEKRHDLLVNVELPRELDGLSLDKRSNDHAFDVAQATAAIVVDQAKLEVEKAKRALEKQEKTFANLTKDRAALSFPAPAAGLLVPGTLEHGKWSNSAEMRRSLRVGERLKSGQVFATIVKPGSIRVRATMPEASFFDVAPGMAAQVVPTSAATAPPLDAKVASVSPVAEDGKFEVFLDLAAADPKWFPGLTCKVKVSQPTRPDALTVPSGAVAKDGDDSYVEVWTEDASGKTHGSAKRTTVKVGLTSGGRTELLDGVKAGDRVVEKPSKDD